LLRRVGDGPRLRPPLFKKGRTIGYSALIEKENFRIRRVAPGNPAQVFNRFLRKGSAKVAQKNQQGRLIAQLVAQRAGTEIQSGHGGVKSNGWNLLHIYFLVEY
jgi:hypothetical protein